MDADGKARLCDLRMDFKEVTGKQFSHFYCPVLFRDEDVELCKAHIVNEAFSGVGRQWTVQRADVDAFYGRYFESDFVDIQHQALGAVSLITGTSTSKKFRPKIFRRGRVVPHYYASPSVSTPANHVQVQLEGGHGTVKLRLKLSPEELEATDRTDLEIRVERDLRLQALVSLLKVAHLTLFRMLGYRYALSAAGYFMGRSILGDFFLQNRHLSKVTVVENAKAYFEEFVNLVRPVLSHVPHLQGTAEDNHLYICETPSRLPWAFLVFAHTTSAIHAIVVPIFEHHDGIARFMSFLKEDGGTIDARLARYEGGEFKVWSNTTRFCWPTSKFW